MESEENQKPRQRPLPRHKAKPTSAKKHKYLRKVTQAKFFYRDREAPKVLIGMDPAGPKKPTMQVKVSPGEVEVVKVSP